MEKALLKKYKEMDDDERKKVKELLRDKQTDEVSVERVEWLYKPDKPDPEDYLLGKRIDKAVEHELEKETDKDAPGAIFSEVVSRRAEMDMQVKMREDPLYMIRKKEEEERRKVLDNPLKMKKLMKELEEKKGKSTKKGEDKMKQKEKKKHKKRSGDSSSDESEDKLLQQYLAIVEQKKKKAESSKAKQEHHDNRTNNDRITDHSSRNKLRDHSSKRVASNERTYHSEKSGKSIKTKENAGENMSNRTQHFSNSGSSSTENNLRLKHKKHYDSEENEDDDNKYGKMKNSHSGNRSNYSARKRSRTPEERQFYRKKRSRTPEYDRRKDQAAQPTKRKLTSEEMEQKRQQMMENARLRDEEREQNVKRYKEEDAENEKLAQSKSGGARFIRPMILKHAEKSSVEDRLKRGVYNIQRTEADLEKHFTKR